MRKPLYLLAVFVFLYTGNAAASGQTTTVGAGTFGSGGTTGGTTVSSIPVKPAPAQYLHQTNFISGGTEPTVVACGKYKSVNVPGSTARMNVSDCQGTRMAPGIRVVQ